MNIIRFTSKCFLLLVLIMQVGCSDSDKSPEWDLRKDKSNYFLQKYSIPTRPISIDATLSIDEWLLDDTLVVCTTYKNAYCFYRLRVDSFHLIDSLGKRGNGPDEFIFPHISSHSSGVYYVIDNGKNKSYFINKDSITQIQTKKKSGLITAPQLINYPIVGYVEDLQSKKIWRKQNMLTGETLDSLCIEGIEGSAMSENLYWSHLGDKVVLGFLNQNQFAVGTPDNAARMRWTLFTGNTQTEKLYYSDVVCGEKCFYLLSQQQVDMKKKSGYSMVEIYDMEGQSLACIDLDIIARRMLVDEKNKKIILLSPLDDNIHIGTLPCK